MAARSRLVSVTTSPTPLNSLDPVGEGLAGSAALIYNDGTVTVYVGGADVTTSGATKGVPVEPGRSLPVAGAGEVLYGRVAAATCDVIVLEIGVAAS